MRYVLRQLVSLILVVAIADLTLGQAHTELVPVDQAVVDLDPLSTGLRRVGTGLRVGGEHTSLYRLHPTPSAHPKQSPANPTYYRIAPGMQAQVARVDYLVPTATNGVGLNIQPAVDGHFVEIISANTLFLLAPLRTQLAPPAASSTDHRLDYRIDGRIDGRVVTNREPPRDAAWPTDLSLTPNDDLPPPQRLETGKPSAPPQSSVPETVISRAAYYRLDVRRRPFPRPTPPPDP